jgi:peptidoglycan/xylan/chitin deacetylase (PgdA/CDA1 family)
VISLYFHRLEVGEHDKFEHLVRKLRSNAYQLIGDPTERLTATGKAAWLSFDDNYRSWHSSLGLLDRLGVKATFYVNTSPMRGVASQEETDTYFDRIRHRGERVALSPSELKDLAASGHTIGGHTHTHRNLAALTTDEALADISRNLDCLEEHLGTRAAHFAVPFGLRRYFPRRLLPRLRELGIKTIAYATPGMQYAASNPQALQRTPWRFDRDPAANWADLRVDGRPFVLLTGRSPVG